MAVPSPFNAGPVASEWDGIAAQANPFGGVSMNTPMQVENSDGAQELYFGGGRNSESYYVDQDIFFARRH